jgi:hypothetical protein
MGAGCCATVAGAAWASSPPDAAGVGARSAFMTADSRPGEADS